MDDLKLKLQIDGLIEKTVAVNRDDYIVGRLPECDLQVPFADISRRHTRFYKTASGEWLVEDMGSKNGTRLNDVQITYPQKLNQGDNVNLGHNISIIIVLDSRPQPQPPEIGSLGEGMTILVKAKELQEQWIEPDTKIENISNYRQAIDRLKYLVDIAKFLNSAESIEAIFSQVQEVVFRDNKNIERLALLIDVTGTGKLEVVNAAAKTLAEQEEMPTDGSWISRTICQKVFAEQVAIKTADAQMDERFEEEMSIIVKGIRSAIAVPLWNEHKVFGVLYGHAQLSSEEWQRGGDEDLSFFSALGNLVASSVQRWLLAQKLRSEETMRQRLERYHSPAVVQQLIAASALVDDRLPPVEREISILFADIVGFTAMSERLSPAEVAKLLNNFFEEMLREVFAAGGTLDKFIGDCIMAFFGAPEPQSDHAERAVEAAVGMLERLDELNASGTLGEPLQLRISINSGKAVVGDVGSLKRVDYTVLGSTINLASRMEKVCPPGECVVSENTYAMLRSREGFESIGDFRFKGIDRPVVVYQTKRHEAS
ncbi:adenylate/guanylate cyclase domain-containing protein [Kamptonema animale CS-326]|jgi:adenylate cyclase|uniref:adenylate/guanylate cyclase domain-containing protein n=1 Tax=Kamptonema animale TaxID=92934 RepID=UPI00232FB8F2|nr:adenylate/guanylate cyclase domain-containing protein [Kamptonema animale]MDB9513422.1 adenylate/guanylate cyclase domain-containing protein [Kamptonema animale CS-326]